MTRRTLALAALAGLMLTSGPHPRAQTPAAQPPLLRIEAGMHTGPTWAVAVDRAGSYAVTVSSDKTARVWDLATGKLLRVLRVPVDSGAGGGLYAAAIAPDGRTIAVGGVTVSGEPASIYLFDRDSGRVVRRLSGLPDYVIALAFSPRGDRLVAGLNSNRGVVVWRTSDWTEAGRDGSFEGPSYSVSLDATGRLAATSGGFVRLYGPDFRLIGKAATPNRTEARGVQFSPDGSRLAVGYDEGNVVDGDYKTHVDVFSSDTLTKLYSTDAKEYVIGNFYTVAWSSDGTSLYAGGSTKKDGAYFVRRWSDGGRGPYVDTVTSQHPILDLAARPAGGVVYVAADPLWGTLGAHDEKIFTVDGPVADNSYSDDLATDAIGSVVNFSFERLSNAPVTFSLADRTLNPRDRTAPSTLINPRRGGAGISGWSEMMPQIQLNAAPLPIGADESPLDVAVAPDGTRSIVATRLYVRQFARDGHELWRVSVPGMPRALNISGNGRVAIVSYSDGTIHWYRQTDGKELLVFFPHADRRRWVVWTPSGYYDASPGGDELIGWQINHGPDQAPDFFPAAQFRATRYRPDVIARILTTADEAEAIELANAAAGRATATNVTERLPPVVEIASPADRTEVTSTPLPVKFTVRTPSDAPVSSVRALVDGRPVDTGAQPAASASGVQELRVPVPDHDSDISIVAENKYAASVPATVRVIWKGPSSRGISVTPDRAIVKPKLYVLAVGVSQYANAQFSLKFPAKDARDFVAAVQTQKDGLYRDVTVYHGAALTDAAATKDEILDGLDWIRKETTFNDVAMVFLAGHGVNDQNNFYFFYPYNIDPDRTMRTGLPFSDIKNAVSAIAGKALFFVDSCHSGNAIGQAARRGASDINAVINELSSAENGVVVFSASTGSESAYELPEWNNGAFTKAVVEGLSGAAAMASNARITFNMLNLYVSERVKELTKGRQHPTMVAPQTVADFPIAVKR